MSRAAARLVDAPPRLPPITMIGPPPRYETRVAFLSLAAVAAAAPVPNVAVVSSIARYPIPVVTVP